MKLCKCGCGKEVTREGNRYIFGHYWRGKVGSNKGKTRSEETLVKMRGREPWNKGKTLSEKHKAKIGGRVPWNKGKKLGPQSPEHKAKIAATNTYNLKDWYEKCPLLSQVEEMKEKDGNIWAHCVNHNCPNSKEKGGWFILDGRQLPRRIDALNDGDDNSCFYCSESCKETCTKFGKRVSELIKQDEIAAGIRSPDPIPLHTSEEYNTWKKEVLKRQREELGCNECEYCGNRNVNELVVHHEKPQKTYPLLALDPDNGIIVCGANSEKKCHYKYGHKIGTKCSTGKLASLICH